MLHQHAWGQCHPLHPGSCNSNGSSSRHQLHSQAKHWSVTHRTHRHIRVNMLVYCAPASRKAALQEPGILGHRQKAPAWLHITAAALVQIHLTCAGFAAAVELIESNVSSEGNIPSELSAAGEAAGPKLSSLLSGGNKKQVETCTRRCVPTCIRGGEGAPGLGPLSMRKEIVVFKDGFRSRQYCLSECAQVCSLMINKDNINSSTSTQQQQQGDSK